ncbi:hypothetical protein D7X96_39145 [Corallococcus interemptor]|uniref:Transposase DDE domain-containing protein n=1 Tax=Corallococcus interemptor TaxID=2316720 RepID=A0A3A8PYY4_9BACT|nr:hypothetical protein D7X96_39145 [Corallococcus interemptor]
MWPRTRRRCEPCLREGNSCACADYQELKAEVGLDHFEGRTWRGFHHHATLCAVAHGFLALRRALFPPEPSALDPADGAARDSTHPAPADWHLPALQHGHQRQSAA